MNQIRTSLKKNQKQIKWILFFLFLSFLISYIFFKKVDQSLLIEEIKNIPNYLQNNHINYLFLHFIILAILIASSITIIGFLLFPIYFLFEFSCVFYNILIFTNIYHLSGLLYGILYAILTKLVYLVLLLIIFKKGYDLIKVGIRYLTNKNDTELKSYIIKSGKRIIVYILAIFMNDILIYLFANRLLLKLLFIIH